MYVGDDLGCNIEAAPAPRRLAEITVDLDGAA
jgi:hypothetical protein